jgi:hypothetical protein
MAHLRDAVVGHGRREGHGRRVGHRFCYAEHIYAVERTTHAIGPGVEDDRLSQRKAMSRKGYATEPYLSPLLGRCVHVISDSGPPRGNERREWPA